MAADPRPAPETGRPKDLVNRDFTATAPNQLWAADLTYVRTASGWVYVTFVLDVFSRRIVGWQTTKRMYTDLALDALRMDLWNRWRTGHDPAGLTHHSAEPSIEPCATPRPSPKPPLSPRSVHVGIPTTVSP